MLSEYIDNVICCSKNCSDLVRHKRDVYLVATDIFFKEFSQSLQSNLSGRSIGNRHIMSKPFERAIVNAFAAIDGVVAGSNPRLEGIGDEYPRKFLDILVSGTNGNAANRAIIIEIKGTGFDPIAAALMSFAIASSKGTSFSCIAGGERIVRNIRPLSTRFIILNNAAFRHEDQHFDLCMTVIGSALKNVDHYAFFPWKYVAEGKYDLIYGNVRNFFKEQVVFLKRPRPVAA